MRTFVSILASLAMLFVAGAANAQLTFSVMGTNLTTASTDLSLAVDGDMIQLDIFATNAGGGVASLGAGIFGFPAGSLTFQSGESADSWFNDSLFFDVLPSNGIGNVEGTAGAVVGGVPQPRTLDANAAIAGNTAIRVFNGVSTQIPSPDGSGEFDLGPGPLYTCTTSCPAAADPGNGAHATLILQVNGVPGPVTVGTDIAVFGGHADGTGAQVADSDVNAVIQVPEAGSMAAGFTALASVFTVVGIGRRKN